MLTLELSRARLLVADTKGLAVQRRPIPLWRKAPELEQSAAPSERNGFTLVPCGADLVLFGGGVYGEAYHVSQSRELTVSISRAEA